MWICSPALDTFCRYKSYRWRALQLRGGPQQKLGRTRLRLGGLIGSIEGFECSEDVCGMILIVSAGVRVYPQILWWGISDVSRARIWGCAATVLLWGCQRGGVASWLVFDLVVFVVVVVG